MTIHEQSERALSVCSLILNMGPRAITKELLDNVSGGDETLYPFACASLMATVAGLDPAGNRDDLELVRQYLSRGVRTPDPNLYRSDPYYAHVVLSEAGIGRWELRRQAYEPFELFPCGDLMRDAAGRVIPQIGFFTERFDYPAVLENGREWMMITPNEIETMRAPIQAATGNVTALGLGLGYYAYSVALKPDVESVTVVERDGDVIGLFNAYILPAFDASVQKKIRIVQADALEFVRDPGMMADTDTLFADIWHDPSDGLDPYLKIKAAEKDFPGTRFTYWIEPTLRCYLEG